jgi:hypothetical protein
VETRTQWISKESKINKQNGGKKNQNKRNKKNHRKNRLRTTCQIYIDWFPEASPTLPRHYHLHKFLFSFAAPSVSPVPFDTIYIRLKRLFCFSGDKNNKIIQKGQEYFNSIAADKTQHRKNEGR